MDPSENQSIASSPRQEVGFEFELTDIEEARRILDSESLSQFDVATIGRPEHWKRLRRRNLPTDRALTGRAIDWLLSMSPPLRPQKLAAEFPRIANALAEIWDEPEQCQAAFGRLLSDSRRGRKGFPRAVYDELVTLRDWTQMF